MLEHSLQVHIQSWVPKKFGIQDKRVAGYRNLSDIGRLHLMLVLTYSATSQTDLSISFVTCYPVLFFQPHFPVPFHRYLRNIF